MTIKQKMERKYNNNNSSISGGVNSEYCDIDDDDNDDTENIYYHEIFLYGGVADLVLHKDLNTLGQLL
jgi:hypothetical protein